MRNKTSLIISIISIIISVVAVCFSYLRMETVDYNWMEVAIGILSLLTTILIGWQIYNVITFESRLKEEKKNIEINLKKYFDEKIEDSISYNTGLTFITTSFLFCQNKELRGALFLYTIFTALSYFIKIKNIKEVLPDDEEDPILHCLGMIKGEVEYIKAQKGNYNIRISQKDQNDWLEILFKVCPQDYDLIEFVKGIKPLLNP